MERRIIVAVVLMVGVMVLSNVLFPPVEVPVQVATDSAAVLEGGRTPAGGAIDETPIPPPDPDPAVFEETGQQAGAGRAATRDSATIPSVAAEPAHDTVVVRSPLYEYRVDTRGAALVSARLLGYADYGESAGDQAVELLRDGDLVLGYRLAVGRDTVDLRRLTFRPTATELTVGETAETLGLSAALPGTPLTIELTYSFQPDTYQIEVDGRVRGIGDRGHTMLVGLGRGLRSNEVNRNEDMGQMAVVVRTTNGDIETTDLDDIEATDFRAVEGGPFTWAASKSKYFLLAFVPDSTGPGVGGVILRGSPEPDAASMELTLPVGAGSDGFAFTLFAGPQDFERLRATGRGLQNVNPIGWSWLQWFIQPVAAIVIAVLVWMHNAFSLAYGWVLILFGVMTRVIFFPIYQIGMRQQMKQMEVQPRVKDIQARYKDDPQKLQQEMMRVYREEGVNPLGGCLPALLPFPILITLFFVFQNTIEFRGVPFWWIPDLSLKDPLYIVPLLMGVSMLGLNWIGQRGMETNAQMKMFTYVLPVVFTFMFSQFAAGLNLYYASSNIASLPQQLFLARERRARRTRMEARAAEDADVKPADGAGTAKGGGGSSGGGNSTKKSSQTQRKRAAGGKRKS